MGHLAFDPIRPRNFFANGSRPDATQKPLPLLDRLIAEARESYATGRCTLEQFEQILDRLLSCDFPIPFSLGLATIPSRLDYGALLTAMRGH